MRPDGGDATGQGQWPDSASGLAAPGTRGWHDALDAHCQRFLGSFPHALGEMVPSSEFTVSLYPHPPTEPRAWLTVRTAGVSDYPMAVPAGREDDRYCELLTYLPSNWDLEASDGWWPGAMLKRLGQFVHESETWFAGGHTVVLCEPGETLAPGTLLTAVLLRAPAVEPNDFKDVAIEGLHCRFLWAFPITAAETELKVEQGAEALLELIEAHAVSHVVDPGRACLVAGERP